MSHSRNRTLGNRLTLEDDVQEKTLEPEAEVVEGKRVGRGENQADARRHLRREDADGHDEKQPEHDEPMAFNRAERKIHCSAGSACSAVDVSPDHAFRAAIIAGTTSNRSPTMP